MGAAAYRRGSEAIRRQLDQEQRPQEFALIEDLNAMERHPDAGLPFRPMRIILHGDQWWIQDAVKGDRGFGYWYSSLRELCKRWQIMITGYDATQHMFTAVPDKKPECDTLEAWLYRCKR